MKNWCADARAQLANVDVVSSLNVVPGDLISFAVEHRQVAGQLETALTADAPVVAVMPAAYGPLGSALTTAIDGFEAALCATGTALTGDYRRMAEDLHDASGAYVTTDETSAAAATETV